MHKRDAATELWFKKLKEDWNEKWYFNTDYLKPKGDEMSKRTEISYRNLKNGNVEFVGYKNVMTLEQLDKEIGGDIRAHRYATGRCYYEIPQLFGKGKTFGIRLWHRQESVLGRDFIAGHQYDKSTWAFFIQFLVEAGERYGEIKADIKAGEVQKILI